MTHGFAWVIFSWVMHQQGIIDTVLTELQTVPHARSIFTLTCSESALADRWQSDSRGEITSGALDRMRRSTALETIQINTTGLSPDQVVELLLSHLR